ncbi:MAG: ABC transporter ATP-binding protein [Candidatus Neomarinimicrobiota bacterium]
MLTVRDLNKSFSNLHVLKDISFEVQAGESIALMGKNGAGKTTLLRILARIAALDQGVITFKNRDLVKDGSDARKFMLYLGHQPALYPSLTAIENLQLALSLRKQAGTEKSIISVLKDAGLSRQNFDPISVYSQGMLQRLKLALANIINWDLLLFDEPFTGLDSEGIKSVDNFLKFSREGRRSYMLVLHNLERALEHCSRFIFLSGGKIGADLSLKNESKLNIRNTFKKLLEN